MPTPLISTSTDTVEAKQSRTVTRIENQLKTFIISSKVAINTITWELKSNPDGLTQEQVTAALGDRAETLLKAASDLKAFVNTYVPGTFPA